MSDTVYSNSISVLVCNKGFRWVKEPFIAKSCDSTAKLHYTHVLRKRITWVESARPTVVSVVRSRDVILVVLEGLTELVSLQSFNVYGRLLCSNRRIVCSRGIEYNRWRFWLWFFVGVVTTNLSVKNMCQLGERNKLEIWAFGFLSESGGLSSIRTSLNVV